MWVAHAAPAAAQPPLEGGGAPQAEPDYFAADPELQDELDISSDLLRSLRPAGYHPFLALSPGDMASLLGELDEISA